MKGEILDICPGVKIYREGGTSILFGAPPEVIKFLVQRKIDFPEYIVLPDTPFRFGTLQNCTEFPLYYYLFVLGHFFKGKKLNIAGPSLHLRANRELLRLCLLGPTKSEYAKIGSSAVYQHLYKEARAMSLKDKAGVEYKIDDFVNFIPFEQNEFQAGSLKVKHLGNNRYEINKEVIDINFDTPQLPPYDLRPDYVPLVPSRFGINVLGGASGFIADQPCSGLLLNHNSEYMLIDCVPYLEYSLNSRGISNNEVSSIYLTHVHDDHCNIFPLVEFAKRIKFLATKEIYWMALQKLSLQTLRPIGDLKDLFEFVEMLPYEKNHYYGITIEPHYTVHSIPTIGATFSIHTGIRTHTMVFIGDNKAFTDMEKMVAEGTVSREKQEKLRALYTDRHDILFADGGRGILHGDPIDALHSHSDRIVFMHMDRLPDEFDATFSVAKAGKKFTIEEGRGDFYILKTMNILQQAFPGLSDHWSNALMNHIRTVSYNSGDIIAKQGESSKGQIFIIISGKCSIVHHDGTKMTEKAIKEAGEFIGEMAVVQGTGTRNASIIAKTPVILGVISDELFLEFLKDEKRIRTMEELWKHRAILEKHAPFSSFPNYVNEQIISSGLVVPVDPGRSLIVEGEKETDFYIVLQGTYSVDIGGERVAEISGGGIFGEISALNRRTRTATITAMTSGIVLRFTNEQILSLFGTVPRLHFYILQMIKNRQRENYARKN